MRATNKGRSGAATIDELVLDEMDGAALERIYEDLSAEAVNGTPGAAARRDAVESELERRDRDERRSQAAARGLSKQKEKKAQTDVLRQLHQRAAEYNANREAFAATLASLDDVVSALEAVLDATAKQSKALYAGYHQVTGEARHQLVGRQAQILKLLLSRWSRRYGLNPAALARQGTNAETMWMRDPDDKTRFRKFAELLPAPALPDLPPLPAENEEE